MERYDYLIAGGGLQGGLMVAAIRARQPRARICLIERAPSLGGNHTWCVFASDLSSSARAWIDPMVVHRWPGYRVFFPNASHEVTGEYLCATSSSLQGVVTGALDQAGCSLLLEREVAVLAAHSVTLTSGETFEAASVIDARGLGKGDGPEGCGFQKFLGREVMLSADHGLDRPTLMDARVDQSAGYRFFYVLPLGPRRLLIEDTYFHDSPKLDRERLALEIDRYAASQGWQIQSVEREETGVLPMPWVEGYRFEPRLPLVAGYRGGWFHPGTGYSFPLAARLAETVASAPADRTIGPELRALARAHRRQARFARGLNRLLFRWYPPNARRSIFERFYRLPPDTVRRFYRLELTPMDRARLLFGRPPRGLSLAHRVRPDRGR